MLELLQRSRQLRWGCDRWPHPFAGLCFCHLETVARVRDPTVVSPPGARRV